jgi:hypothetical protein
MTDPIALDLFIQDFVTTNKLLNVHYPWDSLVARRYVEDGRCRIFSFRSGGREYYAIGQLIVLPDGEWFRVEINRAEIPALPAEDLRFDCLRMMHQNTHYTMEVVRETVSDPVLVKLMTRNRGLINIVFVIREGEIDKNPFLL